MIRGMYAAANGAMVAEADVDTIANNLANVSTTAFKKTLLQVQANPTMDIARIQNDPSTTPGQGVNGTSVSQSVGALGTGAVVYDTPVELSQGTMQKTSNPLDVAIQGNAFFTIQTPNGIRYTRDGAFIKSSDGTLTTHDGNPVLGNNGPITLPDGKVTIATDGTISVDGSSVDQLQLHTFTQISHLHPEGTNLFVDSGAGVAPTDNSTVVQGSLENSNGDVVSSIVDLITAQRWFEMNQKAIQTEDQATAQAIQNVGNSKG